MDTTLVGGAANDTYTATGSTLTSGDQLNGGAGTDTLSITTTAEGTFGTGVTSRDVETVTVTATVGTATIDATNFTGVTTVGSNGSTANVIFSALTAIPAVNVAGTANSVTVGTTAAAVAGAADSATITLNGATGAAAGAQTVTFNGIETLNVVAAAASGSADPAGATTGRSITVSSDALTTLNVTGTAGARLNVNFPTASASITGTLTSGDGADDVAVTANNSGTAKLSVNMGAGNDTVRIGMPPGTTTAANWTVSGGAGTDTLVASFGIDSINGANIADFEAVRLTNASTVSLSATKNTISTATFDISGGSFTGLATGGTVNLISGGSATVANTAWTTPTTDSLTVNVGTASSGTGVTSGTINADGIETVTINSLAAPGVTTARTISLGSSTTTKSLTVNSASDAAITLTASSATVLSTVNAAGVAGNLTFTTAATGGASVTGGAGNDAITGSTGNDTISGGAGNDTITGGRGADSMTGGDGTDTFAFLANTALLSYSTASAPDTITDFVSGTDKLSGTGAVAFLGNFTNIQTALAANAANGVANNSAAFVTSENTLYVFSLAGNAVSATDLVVRMPNTASLQTKDFLLGAQGTGNAVVLTAATIPVVNTASSNAVDGTKTTDLDDSITFSGATSLVGATAAINGGLGTDSLSGSIAVASLATLALNAGGDIGTGDTSGGVALTNVESLTLSISDTNGGTLAVTNIPTTLTTLAVNGANAAVKATFTATGQTISTNNSTNAGNGSTITFGAFARQTATTGASNDTFDTIATDGINASGGAGDDTFNVTNIAAFDDDAIDAAITIAGSTGTDNITFADGLTGTVNLADTAEVSISGVETLNAGKAGVSTTSLDTQTLAITLPGGTTFRTLTGTTVAAVDTGANAGKFDAGESGQGDITFTMTAAQLAALTKVTSNEANGVFTLAISDTGAVTADLSAVTGIVTNVDAVKFNTSSAATVTIAANAVVSAGTGTSDTLIVGADLTSGGAATLAASGFETVTVSTAQTNNALTIQASATTLNVGVAGTYIVGAGVTKTNVTADSPTIKDDNQATAETFTNSGSGTMTVTLVNETAATADTIANTGAGRVTVNASANTGVLTVNLNANSAVDTINLNDGAGTVGLNAAANRVVISNFGATDLITLDTTQTTAGTAAAANAILQVVASVPTGAVTFDTATADVLVLSFDVGGSTEVLAGVLDGAALLANFGGQALSVAANQGVGYILAYDNGNAYLYAVTDRADAADTANGSAAIQAAEIVLVGVINGAAVGSLTAANFPIGA